MVQGSCSSALCAEVFPHSVILSASGSSAILCLCKNLQGFDSEHSSESKNIRGKSLAFSEYKYICHNICLPKVKYRSVHPQCLAASFVTEISFSNPALLQRKQAIKFLCCPLIRILAANDTSKEEEMGKDMHNY